MKKRMFLSTMLMTLVLLVALTTATFAWYTASTGSANTHVVDGTISTSDSTLSLGAFDITCTLSEPTANVGPTGRDGSIKFKAPDGSLIEGTPENYVKSGTVKYALTIANASGNEVALEEAQKWAAVAGTYTITFAAPTTANDDQGLRYADSEENALKQNAEYVITVTVSDKGVVTIGGQETKTGTVTFCIGEAFTGQGTTLTATCTLAKRGSEVVEQDKVATIYAYDEANDNDVKINAWIQNGDSITGTPQAMTKVGETRWYKYDVKAKDLTNLKVKVEGVDKEYDAKEADNYIFYGALYQANPLVISVAGVENSTVEATYFGPKDSDGNYIEFQALGVTISNGQSFKFNFKPDGGSSSDGCYNVVENKIIQETTKVNVILKCYNGSIKLYISKA